MIKSFPKHKHEQISHLKMFKIGRYTLKVRLTELRDNINADWNNKM